MPPYLYNLAEDIGETKNLAAKEPERVARMAEMLQNLIEKGRSTSGSKQEHDVDVRRYRPNLK